MSGLTSLLNIGNSALFASQSAIQVTGNNIANVNTTGYSRQAVRFEEGISIDSRPGQLGTGAKAAEVYRYFNKFVEEQFNDRNAIYKRWDTQQEVLKSVESLFNEANSEGLNAMMNQFFKDWQELAKRPDDDAVREALLAHTENMLMLFHDTDQNLQSMQSQMDDFIKQEVTSVNDLITRIADLNKEIQIHDIPGSNNANTLLDQRNQLVRELAEKMDVDVIDNGSGDFTVNTKAGHTLVDGGEAFAIDFTGPASYKSLNPASSFDGSIGFDGQDEYEYTVEVMQSGTITSNAGSGAAMFRVSLDGGRTWMKDENGNDKLFAARPESDKVNVQGIDIYFNAGTQDLTKGDTFTVVPKNHLKWISPTTEDLNITPQSFLDGTDNSRRLTGGSITGYFALRDFNIGRYRERLDSLSESIAWEVNRLHSQGGGENPLSNLYGTYSVDKTDQPLSSPSSGLHYGDRLAEGNVTVYAYDTSTGELASSASFGPLDFDPATPGIQNFDPDVHSLEDVRDAFNNSMGNYLTASIQDNKLVLNSKSGYAFQLGTDTSGLSAALGLNTFFKGESAATLAIRDDVRQNSSLINAGSVNGGAEANDGDNKTALAIGQLKDKDVRIDTAFETSSNQTLQEYYNSLVGTVGADTANAKFNSMFNQTLAKDLNERQNEVAGVNLDEEMSNLIKFQHSYKAAAKLITTADQMMQTVLGLKN
ncbi:flagellar hook-associated protein FlgK [Desulfovibrio subterraneus]|uniref:flagellar hook-associated protein FlgK n=1 Tax=Desulfovibrio subterraneus TaxID=2718620 RepID=UPI0022B914BE|nr:flagellar hook-associated protein FlgK [Desulfovibrio subterraneus]WBF69096.1 flagellar hook-associated protein FlgK [Desulfovibrio subterraneus]